MSNIFITSDTHFGHDREFIWGPRGFTNHVDHDNKIIENWNSVVQPDDIVYHLGDVILGDNEYGISCLKQLRGNIKILAGNHDTKTRITLYNQLDNVEVIGLAYLIKYRKYNFYLSHYPTLTANLDEGAPLKAKVINLFGHTHQQSNFYMDNPAMYHVGVDSHNCYPVLLDTIIEDINQQAKECLKNVIKGEYSK